MAGGFRGFLAFWLGGAKSPRNQLSVSTTSATSFIGASFADAVLSATGTATASFVGTSFASQGPVSATGTATVSFVGLYDAASPLVTTGTGTATFVGAFTAAAAQAVAEPNYAAAWDNHWQDKWRRDTRKALRLAEVRRSKEYKRLERKLGMLMEHLMMADMTYEKRRVEAKIKLIEIEMKNMLGAAERQAEDEVLEIV